VEALPYFADGDLLFKPGTQYRYSKYGWILASAAIEAAADQPFLTFVREQIFQPLGMDGTGAESATAENPDHVGEPSHVGRELAGVLGQPGQELDRPADGTGRERAEALASGDRRD
jgi:CubicO group peptidase (beta-lactamase class C family)